MAFETNEGGWVVMPLLCRCCVEDGRVMLGRCYVLRISGG